MSTKIYYFSGTGNSYLIAKELHKHIEDSELIPIVKLLKQDTIEIKAEKVGFVFPLHGWTIPVPMSLLLKKAKINADYLFAISVRGGTKCFAFKKINKLLKRNNKSLDSGFIFTMPGNNPKVGSYEVPSKEELDVVEEKVKTRIPSITKIILNKEKHEDEDTDYVEVFSNRLFNYLFERLALFMVGFVEYTNNNNYFYADSKCINCGTCEKACLSEKIKMIDNKPVWQNEVKCYLCYTCLNYCPKEAVQIKDKWFLKSYTKENGRYPHPYATLKEITNQKENNP